MKLSEFSTDKALDVLCELTPYITNIIGDKDLSSELKRKYDPNDLKTQAQIFLEGAKRINTLVPILLKNRREDVYGILSVLNEKTPEEIAKQSFITTGLQIREVVKDKELLDFFKSFAGGEKTE